MNTVRLYLTVFGTWLVLWVGCSTAVYYFAVRGSTPRPATIGGGGQGGSATVIGQGVAIGGAGGAEGGSGVIGHCSKPFIQNGVRVVICNTEAVR